MASRRKSTRVARARKRSQQGSSEASASLTLSHLDARGQARMVNVGEKPVTARTAIARAQVRMRPATLRLLASGEVKKGDVLAVARIAGIQAAKRTPELIPLCHGIALTGSTIEFELRERAGLLRIEAQVSALDRTGAEMEALTAAAVAALTVYDMLKSVDRGMCIEQLGLEEKRGGKSGLWRRRRSSP